MHSALSRYSLARPSAITIPLRRRQWCAEAWLAYASLSYPTLLAAKETFLHPLELETFRQIQYPQKRKQYLQGRFAAKQAASQFIGESDLTQLLTRGGVFHQPLVSQARTAREMPAISIAHTESVAACVAFPPEHPMGLDVECVRGGMDQLIGTQLTPLEKTLQNRDLETSDYFYTRLWTIKEALGKTLSTGLTTPLWIYEIQETFYCPGYTISNFTYFTQYKALSFSAFNCIWSIVMPRNTEHLPLAKQIHAHLR